jgi:hypothetical protein
LKDHLKSKAKSVRASETIFAEGRVRCAGLLISDSFNALS